MLSRRDFAAGLGGLAVAPRVLAEEFPDTPVQIDARQDRYDRLTIPVRLGDGPPHDFVVDTGADCSVLAIDLAESLALPPGKPVLVHGITGAQMTPTVKAPPLVVGGVALKRREFPILPRDRLGADGLLGVDVLQRRRLIMDFKARRFEIQATSPHHGGGGGVRSALVPAHDSFGRLTVIDARAYGALATAFVDSGGGMTIVNETLAAAVRKRGYWREPAQRVMLTGVTQHVLYGEVRLLDRLALGDLKFRNVPVVVSDLHLFNQWGLTGKAAILLGANVLRLFSRIELDYGRRQMLFQAGREPTPLAA
ncbi:aspartyl protease family protein [Caulobacter mirabilis]|uniref:Peptidase A2 domain-containing protein n=1 Tax=Caulobacter mirabilis TaxID=69666 RepID=A0A2D2AYB2_9CAUL|nr:aspartyl protease family protein [Caulobacter mirabilis]ATQ43010.1 hypothetical protein CSW64_11620 [Caulobacter mirabilis]